MLQAPNPTLTAGALAVQYHSNCDHDFGNRIMRPSIVGEGGMTSLTHEDVEAYQRDGVICLREVFDTRWLDIVAKGIRRNLEDPALRYKNVSASGSTGRYLTGMWNWQRIPEFEDFALNSPAGAIAGQLMQADAAVFLEDNWFIKEPGATGRTPWHQDEPYYHVIGQFCSVWLPLDPLDEQNSIEFVRGSHRWNKLFMPPNFEDEKPRDEPREVGGTLYVLAPDIEAERGKYDICSWSLAPGDCVVFSARTLHATPGSPAGRPVSRRLSTRWADEKAVFFDKVYSWTSFVADHGLHTGDLLRGAKFPIAWRRQADGSGSRKAGQ
jgi:ectoine hydroxylase-related dioxygenase (phytanoyl-CoA dioxygenase family)